MYPVKYFGVTGQVVSKLPVGILKVEVSPNASATTTLWVQLHDARVAPGDGAVPLKSWPIAEAGYKEFKKGELRLAVGLYICLSSTAATKTLAVGGSDLMDVLLVEFREAPSLTGVTIAGDLTSSVQELVVWNEASGLSSPKKLYTIRVVDVSLTATSYVQVYAVDSPTTERPLVQAAIVQSGSVSLDFGFDGFSPNCDRKRGCHIVVSSVAGEYSLTSAAVSIEAVYK